MTENIDRRIAFLDIDGTIIAHGGVVAPSTIAAVRDARAAGHLVFICSGRASGDVHPDVAAIGFDGEITNGGVYATVGDETVVSRPMPREAAERLVSVLEAHDTGYVFQSNDHIFADEHILAKVSEFLTITAAERKTEQRQLGLDEDKPMPLPKYRPMSEVDLGDVAKATFISPDAAALGLLQAELGDAFHVIEGSIPLPGGSNGEISMTGVTKGSAIELVLAHLGIDKAAAVGIGDSWNDLEMFDVCGTSFAMGEAPDGVKARAQFVTTGVLDDGVANAFRQLGMID